MSTPPEKAPAAPARPLWIETTTLSHRADGDTVTLGRAGVYESASNDRGELYRLLVGDHGRCTGKIYVDGDDDGQPRAVGWVFAARRPFEGDPYRSSLIETWVTVHRGPPRVTVDYDYA